MPGSGGIQEIPYAWLKIKWIKRPPWRKSEAVFGLCGFLCAICVEITSRGVLRGNFGFVAWRKPRRPPTRGRERGMRGEARAPSGGGRKTRAAVQIRRQAAFGMPSYFPPQLTPQYGESAASPCSARARFASQIAPKAAASPPLPRYGEAVTRRVRLCSAPIKSYIKNRVYMGYMRIFIYGFMGALYYSP